MTTEWNQYGYKASVMVRDLMLVSLLTRIAKGFNDLEFARRVANHFLADWDGANCFEGGARG